MNDQPKNEQMTTNPQRITTDSIDRFRIFLQNAERSHGTIEKYLRDVNELAAWLNQNDDQFVTKETAIQWKRHLQSSGRAPSTINSMLAAVNTYFRFMGWENLHLKAIRLQRCFFRSSKRELTKPEYEILVNTARKQGKEQLALLMETICATGIRVSEVRYITRNAIRHGKAQIEMKGKLRTILIPAALCKKLRRYACQNGIAEGEIFRTKTGARLDRRQIWAQMKALCEKAGIARDKVFPHNLRHLFARCFYRASRDISSLADMLGHSSIETTRIYLISTEDLYAKKIARLGLVQQTK